MSTATIPAPLVQSLYLTLIHSLWQGVLLAAVVALILVATRRAPAQKRYNQLIGALALFAAGCIYTFLKTWEGLREASALIAPLAEGDTVAPVLQAKGMVIEPESFMAGLAHFFNANAANIVSLWFLVICIRCLQLVLGLRSLGLLRRSAVPSQDSSWQLYVKNLAAKMGIHRAVRLAESGMAKVPMVIGHFKPLILIPAGLFAALPAAELEAILIHELAHIRRRDYLVNLLQSFMEIVFFFNPAIWWISSLIRAEREHCCDDMVLSHTSSKKSYIQALVACQEYQMPANNYAMALKRNKRHLADRVKRMISNNNTSLNLMEKSMLAVCLLAAGFLTAAFSNKIRAERPETVKAEMLGTVALTAEHNPQYKPAKTQANTNPAPASPEAEGEALPVASPAQEESPEATEAAEPASLALNGTAETMQDQEAALQADHRKKQAEAKAREAEARQKETEAQRREQLADAQRQREEALARSEAQRKEALSNAKRIREEAQARAEEQRKRGQEDARRVREESLAKAEENRKQALANAQRVRDKSLRMAEENRRKAEQAGRQQRSISDVITESLIRDGIISKNDESLEFELSDKKFVVNDVKQPEPVFQKYKDKYLKLSGNKGSSWSLKTKRDVSH